MANYTQKDLDNFNDLIASKNFAGAEKLAGDLGYGPGAILEYLKNTGNTSGYDAINSWWQSGRKGNPATSNVTTPAATQTTTTANTVAPVTAIGTVSPPSYTTPVTTNTSVTTPAATTTPAVNNVVQPATVTQPPPAPPTGNVRLPVRTAIGDFKLPTLERTNPLTYTQGSITGRGGQPTSPPRTPYTPNSRATPEQIAQFNSQVGAGNYRPALDTARDLGYNPDEVRRHVGQTNPDHLTNVSNALPVTSQWGRYDRSMAGDRRQNSISALGDLMSSIRSGSTPTPRPVQQTTGFRRSGLPVGAPMPTAVNPNAGALGGSYAQSRPEVRMAAGPNTSAGDPGKLAEMTALRRPNTNIGVAPPQELNYEAPMLTPQQEGVRWQALQQQYAQNPPGTIGII